MTMRSAWPMSTVLAGNAKIDSGNSAANVESAAPAPEGDAARARMTWWDVTKTTVGGNAGNQERQRR